MSTYAGNLPFEVSQDDLTHVFSDYGTVKLGLPTNRETKRPRGFDFVEMETEAAQTTAIEALDGSEWMRQELEAKNWGGGSWGNNSGAGGYSRRRY